MKLRLLAGALALALSFVISGHGADAQVNPGTSPLTVKKGGTGAATLTDHGFILGHGTGAMTSLLCASAQLAIGQSAADPICQTVTGDVTISAAGVTAIGANKVTNAQLATMAANTTKCNATGGTAAPTDCTASTMRTNMGVVIGTNVEAWDADLDCIAALGTTGVISRTGAGTCSAGALALSGLATGTQDTVIGYWGSTTATAIAINNCTGALTYSTSTHTFGCNVSAGTGTVTSVTCGTGLNGGTFTTTGTCSIRSPALASANPSNPVGTGSTTGVMMGLGSSCTLTPLFSTRVKVLFHGIVANSTAPSATGVQAYFGTGAAPANGVAFTGTAIDGEQLITSASNNAQSAFATGGIITSLTPGTAYWFDMRQRVTANSGAAFNIHCDILEIP